MSGQNSSQRKLGGRRSDAVKGLAHRRGGYHTFFLPGRWDLEQTLPGRDSPEARMRFGAASQGPECAPDLRIDIRCESGLQRCERWTLTSSTRKPKATGLGLWMTRPSDNPKCRPQRSRIQCESSQFGRQASSLPKTRHLQIQGFARDFDGR
jgi:hypothetical protein